MRRFNFSYFAAVAGCVQVEVETDPLSWIGFLAIETRTPVVPIHVRGSHRIMPKGRSFPLPAPARVRIGRPLTPLSYAGVARRTVRRGVWAGAAVGAAAPYYGAPAYAAPVYAAPGCVQVVNAYGQIVYQCP